MIYNGPSLSKYDYGYLRGGGIDWPTLSAQYYGPPHSFWYNIIPWIILTLGVSAIAAMAYAMVR